MADRENEKGPRILEAPSPDLHRDRVDRRASVVSNFSGESVDLPAVPTRHSKFSTFVEHEIAPPSDGAWGATLPERRQVLCAADPERLVFWALLAICVLTLGACR